jgi:hypothetical protein
MLYKYVVSIYHLSSNNHSTIPAIAKLENEPVFTDVEIDKFNARFIIEPIVDCRLEFWFDNDRIVERKLGKKLFEHFYYAKVVLECVCCENCTRITTNTANRDDYSDISAKMSNLTVHKPESRSWVWYVVRLNRDHNCRYISQRSRDFNDFPYADGEDDDDGIVIDDDDGSMRDSDFDEDDDDDDDDDDDGFKFF